MRRKPELLLTGKLRGYAGEACNARAVASRSSYGLQWRRRARIPGDKTGRLGKYLLVCRRSVESALPAVYLVSTAEARVRLSYLTEASGPG